MDPFQYYQGATGSDAYENDDFARTFLSDEFTLFSHTDSNDNNQTYVSNNEIDQMAVTYFASENDQSTSLDSPNTLSHSQNDPGNLQPSISIDSSDLQDLSRQIMAMPLVEAVDLPLEPTLLDDISAIIESREQDNSTMTSTVPKNPTIIYQSTFASVGPIDYILDSHYCQPCTTVDLPLDFAYQQQLLEYGVEDSKKIQIQCEPRKEFRPRTQNESRISAHYIRCDEGVTPEYPTVLIPASWNFQSDINLIEVMLVTVDKKPHPYSIDNKSSSDTYEESALIFKQHEPNVLYFRLTNDDFQNGYKSFMIELIKSKQDRFITKDRIRSEQLDK